MSNNIYKKLKKEGTDQYFEMVPYSADTAISATTAISAENAEAIGRVEKYSGYFGGKQREGLKFSNPVATPNEALIELNEKGNFSIESLKKHLNLESAQGIQIKPSTTLILDSSRRIEGDKGNEINLEAKFDDYGDAAYNGHDGYDDAFAEFKIKGRSIDLRCHGHGGIALQIAGTDNTGKENKIKFESNRINQIGAAGQYSGPRKGTDKQVGEGGKGLEFGTFNNEHASLYCGDYRFKGDAYVYAATRGNLETASTGKIDYPTQSDDFKDILDNTKRATWEDIISAAKKCRDLEQTVNDLVAQAALDASGIDTSGFALKSELADAVAQAMQDFNIDTTGLATQEWVMGQGYFEIPSDVTLQPAALSYIKMGKEKGNFAVDVTGKYTWELTSPNYCSAADEYGAIHAKGDRVLNYSNESFYSDENKIYYKAEVDTKLADGTEVSAGTIVFGTACADIDASVTFPADVAADKIYAHYLMGSGDTSFYEDEENYVYQGSKNISIKYGETKPISKKAKLDPSTLTPEEIAYYDSQVPVYDEDGKLVSGWEKVFAWTKKTIWSKNEININLETDSKIKFDGKKIETCWGEDENEDPIRMDDILLFTNTLTTNANEVVFEKKISKNGDREGVDSEFVYTFSNNVADPEKVADFAAFKANYDSKHKNHGKSNEELQAMYDAFIAEGPSIEIRVKVSELLGLVSKVAELEDRITQLEGGNS